VSTAAACVSEPREFAGARRQSVENGLAQILDPGSSRQIPFPVISTLTPITLPMESFGARGLDELTIYRLQGERPTTELTPATELTPGHSAPRGVTAVLTHF
jgi:hypothetical protein